MRFKAGLDLNRRKQDITNWEYRMKTFELLNKAIKEKNGKLAWQVLKDCSDGEYKRICLEPASTEY